MKTIKYLHIMHTQEGSYYIMEFDSHDDAMIYIHEGPPDDYVYSLEVTDQPQNAKRWDAEDELNRWRIDQGLTPRWST